MEIILTIIGALILIGVGVVIYLIISKQRKEVTTKVTLIKAYKNEKNMHFSKEFVGSLPKTDSIKIFDYEMEVVHSTFCPQFGLLKIFAVDEKNDWTDEEYVRFHKEGWECQNIVYIKVTN